MNYLNGGYVMLDKADSDIFAKASGALQAGKPILWYESANKCYYIDTIEKTGSDITLTKGGKTIVITSGNVVTELGEVQQHLYAYTLDTNDLSLGSGYSSSDDSYILFMAPVKIEKLADLPVGYYVVASGTIKESSADVSIRFITIKENNKTLQLANGDECVFTISADSFEDFKLF